MRFVQKLTFVGICALLIVILLYVLGKNKDSGVANVSSSTPSTNEQPIVISPKKNIEIPYTFPIASLVVLKPETQKDEFKSFTFASTYPKSDETHLPEIHDFITESKASFLKDYNTVSTKEAKLFASQWPYTFLQTTRITTSSNTVSYIIETYIFEGGAHGNTSVNTFTYDALGKLVTLDDVFSKPYLPTVASLARQYFYVHAELANNGTNNQKDLIDQGTEASQDNFSQWYLTSRTITFIFGQYQVGPYVLGIQEFPLSKSTVSALLSSKYK